MGIFDLVFDCCVIFLYRQKQQASHQCSHSPQLCGQQFGSSSLPIHQPQVLCALYGTTFCCLQSRWLRAGFFLLLESRSPPWRQGQVLWTGTGGGTFDGDLIARKSPGLLKTTQAYPPPPLVPLCPDSSFSCPQCYSRKLTEWKNGDKGTRGPKPRCVSGPRSPVLRLLGRNCWKLAPARRH